MKNINLSNYKIFLFFALLHLKSLSVLGQIELPDIWLKYNFYAPNSEIYWLSDSSYLTITDSIRLFSIENTISSRALHFPDSLFVDGFIHTPNDSNYLCFTANSQPLYRHSYKSTTVLYDLEKDSMIFVSRQQAFNPSLSYDSKFLAYTDENNLFIFDLNSKEERQVTFDGKWNQIINGRSDWVHEEEFGFAKAYHWIPETHQIVYLKYDESQVKTYDLQTWGEELYPNFYSYKYPKAGEKNAYVTLNIYDADESESEEIFETDEEFEYISKLGVSEDANKFYFIATNRLQNYYELISYNSKTNRRHIRYSESSDKYIEMPQKIHFIDEGILLDSYRTGQKHVLLIDSDTTFQDLTPGSFDVGEFLFYDEDEETIYFSAFYQNSYTQSICSAKKDKVKLLTKDDLWYSASVSPNGTFAELKKSSLQTPSTSTLVELKKLKEHTVLSSNDKLQSLVNKSIDSSFISEPQFFEIIAPEGHTISCLKILPANFDSTKKYPVLMHCYGGPGHQLVTNQWNSFDYFFHQLIAQKGCIVVLADGRGTDGKGTDFRQASYGQFGNLEHQDQVSVAKYLRSQSYVDSTRIGIWGWSFGGYLSSLCLLKSPDVFSSAIAVAPVTNWRFYDNIYTERYMGLPNENAEGYDLNSPTSYAKNLQGKFLLIHGTADDNVHIQNSYALQKELLKYNKQFETFYYPDKNHGIYGGTTRYNLYQKMLNFIEINLLENGN